MAELSPASVEALNAVLPVHWSHANPVDILGDATSERYQQALAVCLADENVDGVLVILTPQAMTNPTQVLSALLPVLPIAISQFWPHGRVVRKSRLAGICSPTAKWHISIRRKPLSMPFHFWPDTVKIKYC